MIDDNKARALRDNILKGNVRRWDIETDEGSWDLKNDHLGYFGAIDILTIGGKKTIVFCDPRDSIIKPMLAEWYDDVIWTKYRWNPDTRFVSRPNPDPALVKKNGKWGMVGFSGQRDKKTGLLVPYNDQWYDSICPKQRREQQGFYTGWVFDAEKDGSRVMLTDEGCCLSISIGVALREVKEWDKEDIIHKWIDIDKPCALIHGFRFKGARPHPISKEEARRRIETHSFGKGYYSMDWSVENGRVTLVFAEYSEGDME